MRHCVKLLLCSLFFLVVNPLWKAQQNGTLENQKMEWFEDAKLGIFIHWGIYSVDGLSESWSFFNNYINHQNYMKQLDGFTAARYNPQEWVNLIKNSGAKYSVITTRHHDGVSLWNSKAPLAITTVKDAVAHKDVLTPFVNDLKKAGLKTGLYYSLPDWSHPYYNVETSVKHRYDIKDDPARWNQFIHYYQDQLTELSKQYHPDLLWFDGNWEHTNEEWHSNQTLQLLRKYNPDIIVNSRLDGTGDYETPEQGIPVLDPESKYWELCLTMNDSWGYQPFDNHYKTPNEIIQTLVETISMGGNLLLDIGPKADGTIDQRQVDILKNLGRWTHKYGEAVYGTRRGLPFANYQGKSAVSKDHKTLFLYLNGEKKFDKIDGLKSKIMSATVIGAASGKVLVEQQNGNAVLNYKNVDFDPDVTVVKLQFDEPLQITDPVFTKTPTLQEILHEKNADKAVYEIARQLHFGNNLLNNSGLTSDGENMTIPTDAKTNPEILNWISKNAEALYQTGKGLTQGFYAGMSALSKDKNTLYLFVEGRPNGPIAIKGLKNRIFRTRIVGGGSIIPSEIYNKLYWSPIPGIVYIDVPKDRLDPNLTVIAVLLDGPIQLYSEKIGAVTSNK